MMSGPDILAGVADSVLWFLSGVGCTALVYRMRGYRLDIRRRNGRRGPTCQ